MRRLRHSQDRPTIRGRLGAFVAALWLLLAQSVMAAHVDEPATHGSEVECEVCQVYERTAPPGAGLSEPYPTKRMIRAKNNPAIVRRPLSVDTGRPPSRAPPA